jgi:hypothetical protein
MKKFEEQIGVRLPDGRRFMATALVGPLESDEEILSRMTNDVGTIFHVNGQKLLVTSLKPYRLKNITDDAVEESSEVPSDDSVKPVAAPVPEEVTQEHLEPVVQKLPEPEPQPDPPVIQSAPEPEPKSRRRPSTIVPAVGERWRPKDPRRIASFVVKEVRGAEVLTDDGRSIALGRFDRYVRVDEGAQDVQKHG